MPKRGTETVTIVPRVARDRHGDPVAGATAAPIVVTGCITWPRTSVEEGRGEIVIDGLNVFLPRGSALPDAKDQMEARGTLWDLDGSPADYQAKGAIVVLKKVGT